MNVVHAWMDKQRPERINYIVALPKPYKAGKKVAWLWADPGDPLYELLLDHPAFVRP